MCSHDALRPVRIFFLCLALACLSLFAAACAGFLQPAGRVPQHFRLIVTGGTAGEIDPQGCGCRSLGGMERRAGFAAAEHAAGNPVLLLDSGNLLFASATTPDQEDLRKADCLLRSIDSMQTAALNVSAADCAAGPDFIRSRAGQVMLISANLRDATGALLFSPHMVTTAGRARIGIFGLSGPASPQVPSVQVDDPAACAAAAVKALQRARCDVVVLLSQLSEEHNRRVISAVPGIHFVLGSCDGPARAEPLCSGDSWAISPGQRGTHAAVMACLLDGRGRAFVHAGPPRAEGRPEDQSARGSFTLSLAPLDSSVPNDPAVELLLETCREEGVRRQLESRRLHYRDSVPAVDMNGLSEIQQRRSVRLMNEIACGNHPIAACTADSQLCRDMARLVTESVRAGMSDGAVHFALAREMQSRTRAGDIQLDKPGLLH